MYLTFEQANLVTHKRQMNSRVEGTATDDPKLRAAELGAEFVDKSHFDHKSSANADVWALATR
jgi:hypothetical protein